MTCDKCGKDAPLFKSTGSIKLCHECAHDMGLGHLHPDMGIDNATHTLADFSPKEEVEAHLKAYQDQALPFSFKIKPLIASIRNEVERIEMHSVGDPDYDTIEDLVDLIKGSLGDIQKLVEDAEAKLEGGESFLKKLADLKEPCPECGRDPVGHSWNHAMKKIMLFCEKRHFWPTDKLDHTVFDVPHPSNPDYKCRTCGRNAWGSHMHGVEG